MITIFLLNPYMDLYDNHFFAWSCMIIIFFYGCQPGHSLKIFKVRQGINLMVERKTS